MAARGTCSDGPGGFRLTVMKGKLIALAIVVALAVVCWWPRTDRLDPPPALTAEEIMAMPDAQMAHRVSAHLRHRLAAAEGGLVRWRDLAEPARHVVALSWIEEGCGSGCAGLAQLRAIRAPNVPGLDDLGPAYRAIGAGGVAAFLAECAAGGEGMAQADARFRKLRSNADTRALLIRFIRGHAAEIAAARM
jgi:hypothetical protein